MNIGNLVACVALASSIGFRWLPSFWPSRAVASDEVNTALVNTMRAQLDRCGPEALRTHPCPVCEGGFSESAIWRVGFAGFWVGLLTSGIVVVVWYISCKLLVLAIPLDAAERTDATQSLADIPRWIPHQGSNARMLRIGGE